MLSLTTLALFSGACLELLATVLNLIGLCVNGSVILMASRLRNRLSSGHGTTRRPSRWPQYLLGSVFAGLACRLALASRN